LFSLFNVSEQLPQSLVSFSQKGWQCGLESGTYSSAGLSATTIFTALFIFLPPPAIQLMFITEILRQFGIWIYNTASMGYDGRCSDYSEWKNKRRATGNNFFGYCFWIESGTRLRRRYYRFYAFTLWICTDVEQTASTLNGIRLTMSIFPAVTFVSAFVCLFFYKINKQTEIQITDELAERRKAFKYE